MNAAIKNLLIFAVGAAIGSFATYKFVENKYAKIAQEEIDSVVERFSNRRNEEQNAITDDGVVVASFKKPEQRKYTNYNTMHQGLDVVTSENKQVSPYVITADEFGDASLGYDKSTIFYYNNDDTLADENEEIIPDPDAIVGEDALLNFGESSGDKDIVHVRNERLGIDYEVIRLHKSYRDVILGIEEPVRRKAANGQKQKFDE